MTRGVIREGHLTGLLYELSVGRSPKFNLKRGSYVRDAASRASSQTHRLTAVAGCLRGMLSRVDPRHVDVVVTSL